VIYLTKLQIFDSSLEARLQPNTGLTFKCALTVFTRSGMTPPKVCRLRWKLVHSEHILGLALVWESPRRSVELVDLAAPSQVKSLQF